MTIHTRLVGAIDAVVLSLTAAMTIVMFLALLDPTGPVGNDLVQHYSVTIEQLPI